MSVANIPIPFSFVQFTEAGSYANCESPLVELPMLNTRDLSFQFALNTPPPPGYQFGQQMFGMFSGTGSIVGNELIITAIAFGQVTIDMPLYYPGSPNQLFVASQLSGHPGGIGTYLLNKAVGLTGSVAMLNFYFPLDGFFTGQKMLGTLGARICINCDENAQPGPANDFQWIATSANYDVNSSTMVFTFQPSGMNTEFAALSPGQCFNICIYEIGLVDTNPAGPLSRIDGCTPFSSIGWVSEMRFCSTTLFYKIMDECESYPTSVLQYANFSDAFGFFYNYLGQLMQPGINFLNSIRLPLYLHSPQTTEDEMSYNKSDGSRLKLSHRIWTDYKFKTDWLDRFYHKCLAVATAHDLVYITCHYEGLDPWDIEPADGGFVDENSYQTGDATQFIRIEKIEVEWQQEDRPRWKLGQAKGTLRLAVAASTVNSNCD